jgi:hypothetical protein
MNTVALRFVPARPSFGVTPRSTTVPPKLITHYICPFFRSPKRTSSDLSARSWCTHAPRPEISTALWTTLRSLIFTEEYASEVPHAFKDIAQHQPLSAYSVDEAARAARSSPTPYRLEEG